jgi:rhodanese-related sulfurtransferase
MFGPRVKTISIDQLADKLKAGDPVLLDVREPGEFAAGHVPGAVNVPLAALRHQAGGLDASAETLLICESGRRSETAAKILTRAGFERAYSVKGGTSAWRGRLAR